MDLEHTDPLAEISAAQKSGLIDTLITQRQQQLVQLEELIALDDSMPAELATEDYRQNQATNKKLAEQMRYTIQFLRARKREILAPRDQ